MKDYLRQIVEQEDLSREDMAIVMENLMLGQYSDIQVAGFLVGLAIKAATPEELASATEVMRKSCKKVDLGTSDFVDVGSTGGAVTDTFNISTAAMFVAAGAGVPVAKHGNRSIRAECGSNDVLEALGVNVHMQPDEVAAVMKELGVCYMFGSILHPIMKFATPTRRGLGIRTLFNLLEPLANPAGAKRQLIGVFSKESMELMAKALAILGDSHVMLVHGEDGMDEITTVGKTDVIEVRGKEIKHYTIQPDDFGIPRASGEQLRGGSLDERARILTQVLKGEPGPQLDIVLLNGAATIYIAGHAKSIAEGLEMARESVSSGKAWEKLEALRTAGRAV